MLNIATRYARANSGLAFRPDANTVLWLPGQDDYPSTTIRDRSGNGNDGTITGATWVKISSGLWVLSFDGLNDKVAMASSSVCQLGTSDFTLEVWVRENTMGGYDNVFAKRQAGTDTWGLYLFNNVVYAYATSGGVGATSTYDAVSVNGIWFHIVYSGDRSGNQELIVNGVLRDSDDMTAVGNLDNSGTLQIGAELAANWFYGEIALPRIYLRTMSLTEAVAHYNQERHLFGV